MSENNLRPVRSQLGSITGRFSASRLTRRVSFPDRQLVVSSSVGRPGGRAGRQPGPANPYKTEADSPSTDSFRSSGPFGFSRSGTPETSASESKRRVVRPNSGRHVGSGKTTWTVADSSAHEDHPSDGVVRRFSGTHGFMRADDIFQMSSDSLNDGSPWIHTHKHTHIATNRVGMLTQRFSSRFRGIETSRSRRNINLISSSIRIANPSNASSNSEEGRFGERCTDLRAEKRSSKHGTLLCGGRNMTTAPQGTRPSPPCRSRAVGAGTAVDRRRNP